MVVNGFKGGDGLFVFGYGFYENFWVKMEKIEFNCYLLI